jgi:CPA2 family monovalent cation:H+ antiporter-2
MKVWRQPLHTALVVAIGLAQIGEFSFILIHQANLLKLLPHDSGHLLVAAAIVSIMLNPFLFANLPWVEAQLSKWRWLRDPPHPFARPMMAHLKDEFLLCNDKLCGK